MKKLRKILTTTLLGAIFATTLVFAAVPTVSIQAKADVHSTTKEDGWIDGLAEPENYAYSFAVVGDPQYMTQYDAKFGTTYVKDTEYK